MKVSDTKVTHFTLILALCTRLYRSHLQKPVSMKQTKHSRKSEAQNLCSKCPPFTRTHVFKWLRHCAIADGFGGSRGATQLHFLQPGVKVNGYYYRNTVLLNMLMLDIRSVFGNYYVLARWGTNTSCTWHVHCHHAAERDARVYPSRDMATYFARFESGGLQHLHGVCFKRGSTARGSMIIIIIIIKEKIKVT